MTKVGEIPNKVYYIFFPVAIIFLIFGVIQLRQTFAELTAIEEELSKLGVQSHLRSKLKNKMDSMNQGDAIERLLLTGSTAQLAGAALLGTVNQIVEAAGGEIRSTSINLPELSPPFQKIGAEVSFLSDIRALHDILLQLSSEIPMINTESLSIDTGNSSEPHPQLRITLKFFGLTKSVEN